MFERYTEPARRILFFARHAVHEHGGDAIEPEHLLAGLLREGSVMTPSVIGSRANMAALQERLQTALAREGAIVWLGAEIPFSAGAKVALQRAAEEADRLGDAQIRPAHLLLALLRDDRTGPLLSEAGIEYQAVADNLRPQPMEQPADAVELHPVEIHPPHAPIRSVRDFLLQLLTITAGVLIALSLEGLLEWNHHRTLVREARESMAREIADNAKEIEGALAGYLERNKRLETALRFANEMLTEKKSDVRQLNIGFDMAELSAASWQSAERTGALGYMDYADVREYSNLYAVQELFASHQRRALERMTEALAIFAHGDPFRASPADLEAFRQRVLAHRADLFVEEQLGRRLAEVYRKALKR